MSDTVGGPIYIGGEKPGDEFIDDHAVTMDFGTQIIESAVLAGPVTFTGTLTITGNLVVV